VTSGSAPDSRAVRKGVAAPSIDSSVGLGLLPALLSLVAGSADVISFLGLGGLFVAHITGNLIILAARVVTGVRVEIAPVLSVPVFILVLALTRLLVARLDGVEVGSLRVLLLLQFLMLSGFLALGVAAGSHVDPNSVVAVAAGMAGVCGLSVQNALVQVSLKGAPSTAVMTSNITRFTMDLGEVLLGDDPAEIATARRRAAHTWPAIVGFAFGAALGAALFAAVGLQSLALPAGVALLALAVTGRPG
jgi:uncharacterized membrane protein YoaK (UPF0700 family)